MGCSLLRFRVWGLGFWVRGKQITYFEGDRPHYDVLAHGLHGVHRLSFSVLRVEGLGFRVYARTCTNVVPHYS